jgi:hypothetical protein
MHVIVKYLERFFSHFTIAVVAVFITLTIGKHSKTLHCLVTVNIGKHWNFTTVTVWSLWLLENIGMLCTHFTTVTVGHCDMTIEIFGRLCTHFTTVTVWSLWLLENIEKALHSFQCLVSVHCNYWKTLERLLHSFQCLVSVVTIGKHPARLCTHFISVTIGKHPERLCTYFNVWSV